MLTKLNTPEMASCFVKWLHQYIDATSIDNGIVAGGAVNAFVMKAIYGIDLPVNDVDVFITRYSVRDSSTMPIREKLHGFNLENDYGHINASPVSKGKYSVVTTTRNGLLNTVNAISPNNYVVRGAKRALYVIESFDINCCQIAFDMKTRLFWWTPEYEAFIKTMQIKTTALYTPWHTVIRLAKKQKDIPGSYLNLDDELRLITSFVDHSCDLIMVDLYDGERRGMVELSFGTQYKEKYEGIVDVFGEKLSLVDEGKGLFTIAHNVDYDIPKNYINPRYMHPDRYLNMWRKGLDIMTPKKTRRAYKEAYVIAKDHPLIFNKLCMEPTFVTHDTVSLLNRATKVLNEHNLSYMFVNCKDIIEVIDCIKFIKELEEEYGVSVYGHLETSLARYDLRSQENRNIIKRRLLELLEGDNRQLQTPFYVGDYGEYATQLTTTISLRNEGHNMHHCAGGYSDSVESGHSFIFHLEDGEGGCSTVEYRLKLREEVGNVKILRFVIEQNKAFGNKVPSDACIRIGEELCEYLNCIYVPFKYKDSKDSHKLIYEEGF